MLSWLKNKLGLIKPTSNLPVPGEVWDIRNDSPWPEYGVGSTVLDVKEGWVKYKIGSGGPFNDERMTLSNWFRVFRKREP